MKALIASGILVCASLASPAEAGELPKRTHFFKSGNQLLADCQGEPSSVMLCLGYVQAVSDTAGGLGVTDGITEFEVPPGVVAGQLRDIVVKYLIEHPEMRHVPAAQLVYIALAIAFKK